MTRAIEPLVVDIDLDQERGPVPELRWLPIAVLRVDETYQRPIGPAGVATIKTIVKGFDWRMFGPVVVSPIEGGLYAIVDGQHRTTAAATCGLAEVPCLIIQADRRMQARAFTAINGRVTPVTSHSLFRSRLAAREPRALEVRATCEAAGVELVTYNMATARMKARETIACRCLETQLARHGRPILEAALRCLVAAAHDVPGLLAPVTIQAFCEVLVDHPEWFADERLVGAFSGFDLATQLVKARDDARAKRMPVLPFVAAAAITHADLKLPRRRVAA